MNFLEILGIFFLAVIVLNIVIGVFAVKAAAASNDEETEVLYSPANKLKVVAHN